MGHTQIVVVVVVATAVLALILGIGLRSGANRLDRAVGQFDRDRAALADDPALDAGIDILTPGSAWHPDGTEPPAQPSTGQPALYVISDPHPHKPKGRHRS